MKFDLAHTNCDGAVYPIQHEKIEFWLKLAQCAKWPNMQLNSLFRNAINSLKPRDQAIVDDQEKQTYKISTSMKRSELTGVTPDPCSTSLGTF